MSPHRLLPDGGVALVTGANAGNGSFLRGLPTAISTENSKIAGRLKSSIASTAALTAPAQPPTQDIDQKSGAIRFIVNGHEEARVDPAGLRVRDDTQYCGAATDARSPHSYDMTVAASAH